MPPELDRWTERAHQSLIELFGAQHGYRVSFSLLAFRSHTRGLSYGPPVWTPQDSEAYEADLTKAGQIISDALEELGVSSVAVTPGAAVAPVSNHVFIAHGHDDQALQATARFIERLKLPVTILHEQPNRGRTIIEKFVDYSDVGFAVVLLTPDDRCGPVGAKPEELKLRPRQNVILELGFFLGKLGRHRVCALHKAGAEIPSDYDGVVFILMDPACSWKLTLAKELKAAGLPVDLNLAM